MGQIVPFCVHTDMGTDSHTQPSPPHAGWDVSTHHFQFLLRPLLSWFEFDKNVTLSTVGKQHSLLLGGGRKRPLGCTPGDRQLPPILVVTPSISAQSSSWGFGRGDFPLLPTCQEKFPTAATTTWNQAQGAPPLSNFTPPRPKLVGHSSLLRCPWLGHRMAGTAHGAHMPQTPSSPRAG